MDEIDELLAMGDPMRNATVAPIEAGARHTFTELTMQTAPEMTGQPSASPLPARPRRRLALILAAAVGAVGIPAAAIALSGGIHTGFFPGDNDTESVAGSEYLNVSDPAIVDIVREEAAKVTVPPGATLDAVIGLYPIAEPTVEQREGIIGRLQSHAECLWYAHWMAGDSQARARDAAIMARLAKTEWGQHFAPGDAGPQLLRDRVEQVRRGDETLVRGFIAVNC